MSGRALEQIDCWIFDLDNTLYSAGTRLFAQIDVRMKAFIARELKLSREDAFLLQKRYYREHGSTLRGLMLHHGIDPDAFLDEVHDIDHSVLAPHPALVAAIRALPGRKLVYTNGSAGHARAVLARLGAADLFEAIFDIRAGSYVPKPDPASYARLVAAHRIVPGHAAMFEDSFRNLKPAAALGMLTVWVRHPEHVPTPDDDLSHCHHVVDDLVAWLEAIMGRGAR